MCLVSASHSNKFGRKAVNLEMVFRISGKVALITGGASGIGLCFAKELLRKGLRGVVLADVNSDFGKTALQTIETEFGPKKAVFVKTDVTNKSSFQGAFEETISEYENIDILVNNAGIMNDAVWEKEIAINLNGVIHGMLLGLENYIPKHKNGTEGVIVNISSILGLKGVPIFPIYSATKFGVVGLSQAWGDQVHYQRTKVKVLVLCPGVTNTPLINDMFGRSLGPFYDQLTQHASVGLEKQAPESLARALVEVVEAGESGSIWVAEEDKAPYQFTTPDRTSFAPK